MTMTGPSVPSPAPATPPAAKPATAPAPAKTAITLESLSDKAKINIAAAKADLKRVDEAFGGSHGDIPEGALRDFVNRHFTPEKLRTFAMELARDWERELAGTLPAERQKERNATPEQWAKERDERYAKESGEHNLTADQQRERDRARGQGLTLNQPGTRSPGVGQPNYAPGQPVIGESGPVSGYASGRVDDADAAALREGIANPADVADRRANSVAADLRGDGDVEAAALREGVGSPADVADRGARTAADKARADAAAKAKV